MQATRFSRSRSRAVLFAAVILFAFARKATCQTHPFEIRMGQIQSELAELNIASEQAIAKKDFKSASEAEARTQELSVILSKLSSLSWANIAARRIAQASKNAFKASFDLKHAELSDQIQTSLGVALMILEYAASRGARTVCLESVGNRLGSDLTIQIDSATFPLIRDSETIRRDLQRSNNDIRQYFKAVAKDARLDSNKRGLFNMFENVTDDSQARFEHLAREHLRLVEDALRVHYQPRAQVYDNTMQADENMIRNLLYQLNKSNNELKMRMDLESLFENMSDYLITTYSFMHSWEGIAFLRLKLRKLGYVVYQPKESIRVCVDLWDSGEDLLEEGDCELEDYDLEDLKLFKSLQENSPIF